MSANNKPALVVPGGLDTPFVAEGIIFLRKGGRTVTATGEELHRLLQSRSVEVERWERRGSPTLVLDDLDSREIEETGRQATAKDRFQFRNAGDPEAVLIDLGMWNRGMMTNAADVCFGKRPDIRP